MEDDELLLKLEIVNRKIIMLEKILKRDSFEKEQTLKIYHRISELSVDRCTLIHML